MYFINSLKWLHIAYCSRNGCLVTVKTVWAIFHLNNKGAKRKLKVNFNNQTLPFCLSANTLEYQNAHILSTPHISSQIADLMHRTLEVTGCWVNNLANSYVSWSFKQQSTVLVPRCSYLTHWSSACHQQRLANHDWMPVSYISRQFSYPRSHPTCSALLQRSNSVLSCPDGAWTDLFHSRLVCPLSGNACHLKSRHPFVVAAQLISLYDNDNKPWADSLCEVVREHWNSALSSPTSPPLLEWPCQEQRVSSLTAFALVSNISALAYTNEV